MKNDVSEGFSQYNEGIGIEEKYEWLVHLKNILINEQQEELDRLKNEIIWGEDVYVMMNVREWEEWLKVKHIDKGTWLVAKMKKMSQQFNF